MASQQEKNTAFSAALEALFEEYPVVACEGTSGTIKDNRGFRTSAIIFLKSAGKSDGPTARFMALDTGVPNELIDLTYTLIYGDTE